MMKRALILTGTEEPPAPTRLLQAGALSAVLEGGALRSIRWHGVEAVRAISFLVRDEDWGTYAPGGIVPLVEADDESFSVRFHGAWTSSTGAKLNFSAWIEAHACGALSFKVSAIPVGNFSTNRTGFNILHPIIGVAGQPATVEHVDGSHEEAVFPLAIDPAQPFLEMRAITHQVMPGVRATVRMEGDTFEMEDQRNWSDASFKTYVRPLALPWPYVLPAGETVTQSVTVTFQGEAATLPAAARGDAPVEIAIERGYRNPAPLFGLNITPEEAPATLHALDALDAISPRHLILSFDPLQGHGVAALQAFRQLQQATDVPSTLEITLPCRDAPLAELHTIARQTAAAGLILDAILVVPAPDLKSTPPGSKWPACPPMEDVYAAARAAFPGVRLGGGMLSYFTELNRKRVPADHLDFVSHTTTPLVHAADDLSVMQTLEALPFITGSVRAIFGDIPYCIGPSMIGMRHNPYGSGLAKGDGNRRLTMVSEDPRQRGLFAAAWMVGYAAATAGAGLEMLTLGALTGSFGVLDPDGQRRPAFHAAKALASLSGKPTRVTTSADTSRVLALTAGSTLIVANISSDAHEIMLPSAARVLDEETFHHARNNDLLPVRAPSDGCILLGAYGIAICDSAEPA